MKIVNWLITLFRNLIGIKPVVVETTVPTPPVVNQTKIVRVHAIVKPVHRRPRLSAIVDTVTLPEVRCQPLGKHRIRIETDGSIQKVLGEIANNGFARVRPFGVPHAEHRQVRLATA